MIGMILVTHGRLAIELVAALEHVVGEQQNVHTICIDADDDMESRRADIVRAVSQADEGDGVILLTDMFGGTPSNLAISVIDNTVNETEVIAGVNLPMLIKLSSIRDSEPLSQAIESAQDAGRKYINVASKLLGQENRSGVGHQKKKA